MSLDLLSKCLELEESDSAPSTNRGKKKKKTNNAMELITTDRKGVWRQLRQIKKKQQKDVIEKRKRKPFKSAIEAYREENTYDNTERNIEALLKSSELGKVKEDVAEKILHEQPCKLSKDIVEKPVVFEGESIFTEEDFQKFAREYNP